jgi:hypothetical protein
MKSIICVVFISLLSAFFINPVSAQKNVVKYKPVGFLMIAASGGSGVSFSTGFAYERVLSSTLTIQGSMDFAFGGALTGVSIISFTPDLRAYILDESLRGLYLGGFYNLGFGSFSGVLMGIGPQVGYQKLFLNDQLAVGGNFQLGAMISVSSFGTSAGLMIRPTASIGYAFFR